ncbi:electron transfer flavoprotein subunit beta/FixA family protein [Burkholderia sp. Ac-20379]|uniref:electron transfer flavoprotein subunit beta/FixA family protein n=1 Tax=Burkholderia sp. Ac-20379 TaxID=2703900 RepID=UPI001981D298|nr:electron transfer flavoprotein subunit beta/FixA family protein [Burkholderia sp. Ac-20379]MBN3722987.1 electron transfer flavoprotein subunit beta/FixA family protein [Burkholderia sp. Ac-20379]
MNAPRKLSRIAVLVSVGRHPVSGAPRYSRNDAAALELGRTLAGEHGTQLEVLHAGDPNDPALADYLALGARKIDVIECRPGDDAVAPLAGRLAGVDLVLTGTRAEGAFDTGLLPYQVAAKLDYRLAGTAVDIEVQNGEAVIRQFLPKGLRRRVAVTLPAVVAVHPLANAQPRYAYARQRAGSVAPVPAAAVAAPAASADFAAWKTAPTERKPVKLVAAEKRSGHARMLSATTTESRGGNVVNEGSSVEKAQVILAYLREHQLIDY